MTIGVPAASQSAPYSPSFGQHQFGGLGRGAVSAPEYSTGPKYTPGLIFFTWFYHQILILKNIFVNEAIQLSDQIICI